MFKILFRMFTWRHHSTLLCWNVVKFFWREIGEIVRYLPDKKNKNFASILNYRNCADRAQSLPGTAPQQLAHNVLNFIQIGSLSAELQPNAWSLFFWPTEYLQYSPELIRPNFGRISVVTSEQRQSILRVFSPINIALYSMSGLGPMNSVLRRGDDPRRARGKFGWINLPDRPNTPIIANWTGPYSDTRQGQTPDCKRWTSLLSAAKWAVRLHTRAKSDICDCLVVAVGDMRVEEDEWKDQLMEDLASYTSNLERLDSETMELIGEGRSHRNRRQAPTNVQTANIQITYITCKSLNLFIYLFIYNDIVHEYTKEC